MKMMAFAILAVHAMALIRINIQVIEKMVTVNTGMTLQ